MKEMKKHGVVTLNWQANLLVLRAYGPFNEEGIEAIFHEAQQSVINRQLQSWNRLEILDDETLGSPAVLNRVKDLYTWFENNGCEHTALVVSNCVQIYVAEELLKSKAKIFRDLDAAKKWLSEQP
ncbi:hypothetical protein [Thalassomonas actiniarum]|uniref:Uncharacterized protein n=1 Tax=Thalassomonas actiniarum TaxID=485447 RepID=A0AAE9YQA4_9GAMM|nr:hypothetical protein [Thalassomonas actiniarum]WDD98533.1 hypothetical protein SG35_025305 [Thalassomonas actiniarum]